MIMSTPPPPAQYRPKVYAHNILVYDAYEENEHYTRSTKARLRLQENEKFGKNCTET